VIHWKSNEAFGFFTAFKQPLFDSQSAKLIQIAFKHARQVKAESLPVKVCVEFSVTPMVQDIKQIHISTYGDMPGFTWVGKVNHVLDCPSSS
jgi:hypothetical protein